MPRYTISRHRDHPDGDHYDFFLEDGEVLRTWRMDSIHFLKMQTAQRIKAHRLEYLDYSGEVSDDRGTVEPWDTGEYLIDAQSAIHLRLALHGEKIKTRLCFDQRGEDAAEWLVYDGAQKLRRLVMSHYRQNPPPDPDSEELVKVQQDLSEWERTLTRVADRFVKGHDVDWSKVECDTGLPKRIRDLRAQWVHPWLVQAYRFAMRIDRWMRQMRAYHTQSQPQT